jgi:hypothetical protein
MQAELGGLLNEQLEYKEELAAEATAEQRQEADLIRAGWRQEQEAAAAQATHERVRQQREAEETLAANRWASCHVSRRWWKRQPERCCTCLHTAHPLAGLSALLLSPAGSARRRSHSKPPRSRQLTKRWCNRGGPQPLPQKHGRPPPSHNGGLLPWLIGRRWRHRWSERKPAMLNEMLSCIES